MSAVVTWIGVDVSKAVLDAAWATGEELRRASAANDRAGIAALVGQLPPSGEARLVVEATGGYERVLVTALVEAGYRTAVVNPRQVRDFAPARISSVERSRHDSIRLNSSHSTVASFPLAKGFPCPPLPKNAFWSFPRSAFTRSAASRGSRRTWTGICQRGSWIDWRRLSCGRVAPTYNRNMDADDSNPMQFPDPVPAELAGKWVAWDEDALHIVASGNTWEEALANARAKGVAEPSLDKVPPYPFIGHVGRFIATSG